MAKVEIISLRNYDTIKSLSNDEYSAFEFVIADNPESKQLCDVLAQQTHYTSEEWQNTFYDAVSKYVGRRGLNEE